jgi:hypothetical protein
MNQETIQMNSDEKRKHFAECLIAQAAGKMIQELSYENGEPKWFDSDSPRLMLFCPMHAHRLRIKPDPSQEVARGHNPHKYTVGNVGNGWRLVDASEGLGQEHSPKWWNACQWRSANWIEFDSTIGGHWEECTLRTRLSREALAALDKPKVRPWANQDELPPLPIQVRWKYSRNRTFIAHASENYIWLGSATTGIPYAEALKDLEQLDGKPCGVVCCTTPSK